MDLNKHTYVQDFLTHNAQSFPEKVALVYQNQRMTYWEINEQSDALAQWLVEYGIQPGDRILILLDNSPEYVISYYAILTSGAVAAFGPTSPMCSLRRHENYMPGRRWKSNSKMLCMRLTQQPSHFA